MSSPKLNLVVFLFLLILLGVGAILYAKKADLKKTAIETSDSKKTSMSKFSLKIWDSKISPEIQQTQLEAESTKEGKKLVLELTEDDVESFNYGYLILNQAGAEKLKTGFNPKNDMFFMNNFFSLSLNDNQLVTGTFSDERLSQVPQHNYISAAMNEGKTDLSITIFPYSIDHYARPEIKQLHDYFFSIGKAKEPWKEQPTQQ